MHSIFFQQNILKMLKAGFRIKEYIRTRERDTHTALEHRSEFYFELWRDAATELGARTEVLGDDFLELSCDGAITRVQQNTTALDDAVTVALAKNKPLVHRILNRQGLRTPNYCEFRLDRMAKAMAFIHSVEGECVVKPANGGGGEGVTTGVVRSFDLARASALAANYDSNLLIERQFKGDVYRLLYFRGTLLDAVLRKPPTAVADGKLTVRELVNRENDLRLKEGAHVAHSMIRMDMDMQRTLSQQNMGLSSVPNKGVAVRLKRVTNDNSRYDNFSALNILCKSIIDDGATAAALVGVQLAGIDVITTDPGVPLSESGGVILEVNATPSYHHHYYKRDGRYAVAAHILPYLLSTQHQDAAINSKVA